MKLHNTSLPPRALFGYTPRFVSNANSTATVRIDLNGSTRKNKKLQSGLPPPTTIATFKGIIKRPKQRDFLDTQDLATF